MQKQRELTYSILDFVSFRVINTQSFLSNLLEDVGVEYENMRKRISDKECDFLVYIGNFQPNLEDCYIMEDRYFLRRDYFFCRNEAYKLARWNVEISSFDGLTPIVLRIETNPFGSMFITSLINYLVSFELNENGCSLVHASAICKEEGEDGYIFASVSGGGKTLLALNFVEEGFKLLGDNFVNVRNGEIFGFHTPLNIFTYNLSSLIRKKIKKRSLVPKYLIYRLTGGYWKPFIKLNFRKLFPKLSANKSKISKAFLLVRGQKFKIRNITETEFVDRLLIAQQIEFNVPSRYISAHSIFFPQSKLAFFWEKFKKNLLENFGNCTFHEITIPNHYIRDEFQIVQRRLVESGLLE
ncbi:MAG: hypothetical protein OEZ25_01625 [Candidatus Bathyarchaeota archaeon]|nr:hypothetical protein [Candidatus Bathyarchaeota archaeon]